MKFLDVIKSMKIVEKIKIATGKIAAFSVMVWQKILDLFQNEKLKNFFTSKIFLRTMFGLVVLFALLQVVFAVLIYGFRAEDKYTRIAAAIIPFPAAIANQDFISCKDYLKEKDYVHHFYNATQQDGIDYKEVDKQIVDQLIENKLIKYQALVNKAKVKKSDVDAAVNEIVAQNGGEEQVGKVLNDLYGLNLKQFEKLVRTQMIRDKLDQDLIARVTVSHILVRVDQNAPEDQSNAAKAKIEGYKTEITNGLDFAEAAKKYSEDTGSAEQGGALEPFSEGEMVPEFSKTAFETEVGKISDPVRSEFGWHIIKVEKKTGKIQKTFGDWLDEIKNKSLILKLVK